MIPLPASASRRARPCIGHAVLWMLVLLAFSIAAPARAQLGADALPDLSSLASEIARVTEPPPDPAGLFRTSLEVPSVAPGETARSIGRQLRELMEAEAGAQPGFAQLEAGMPAVVTGIENGLEGVGFAARDFGVAVAYAFIYNWEAATGRTIPEEPSAAAARTIATAVADHWGAAYRAMSPAEQEAAYESILASTTLLSAFAQQFASMGASEAEAGMREAASTTFQALFGVPPEAVSVDGEGRISGLAAASSSATASSEPAGTEAVAGSDAAPGDAPIEAKDLPPASFDGVEVYMKYTVSYGINGINVSKDLLLLFPDGTALSDIPRAEVASFDLATLTAAFKPVRRNRHVGTWRREADTLVLTFMGETRRLPRVPRGWWDDDSPPDPNDGEDTYFPIVQPSAKHLVGPWITKSLMVSGTPGGALPSVAAGSTTDRVYYADGTFSQDRESFVGATNANVGDAYGGSGATVGYFGENKGRAAGSWRLDGPLLTIEQDGQRTVQLAFILPHWSKENPDSDMWIDGKIWERPEPSEQ